MRLLGRLESTRGAGRKASGPSRALLLGEPNPGCTSRFWAPGLQCPFCAKGRAAGRRGSCHPALGLGRLPRPGAPPQPATNEAVKKERDQRPPGMPRTRPFPSGKRRWGMRGCHCSLRETVGEGRPQPQRKSCIGRGPARQREGGGLPLRPKGGGGSPKRQSLRSPKDRLEPGSFPALRLLHNAKLCKSCIRTC